MDPTNRKRPLPFGLPRVAAYSSLGTSHAFMTAALDDDGHEEHVEAGLDALAFA